MGTTTNSKLLTAGLLAVTQTSLLAATLTPPSPPTLPVMPNPRITIAFMGDSYAAGEGAPNPGPAWDFEPCHRSDQNGRVAAGNTLVAALGLASSLAVQPSLTHPIHNLEYTDVACSGATINQGILGQYGGVTPLRPSGPGPARTPLPTQIQQVKNWLATVNRGNADVVVISIGGNDVGFADVVSACLHPFDVTKNSIILGNGCQTDPILASKMEDGDQTHTNPALIGFSRLTAAFQEMDAEIRAQLNPSRIILVDYPNSLHDRYQSYCDHYDENFSILPNSDGSYSANNNDLFGATEHISASDAAWIETKLIHRLNSVRATLATQLHWEYVDIQDFTLTHGFCETDSVTWFNTPKRSFAKQGDFNGTAHPNAAGYKVYEHFLLRQLAQDLAVHITQDPSGADEPYAFFLTVRNPPPPPPGTNVPDVANRPPIVVNQNTYQQVLGSGNGSQIFLPDFLMQFQYLLNATPNYITDRKVQISTADFRNNPLPSQIQEFAPKLALQSGLLQAVIPTNSFQPDSIIYVRWAFKSRPYWDGAATPTAAYTSQQKFRIKNGDEFMVPVN